MIKITVGKVLAVLMVITGIAGAISNIISNTQVALWQFNCVCWAVVSLMIEFRLDKAEKEYEELVDIIFNAYDESKNAEETKEDAKQFGKAKKQSYIYVNKK